jgi:hypothetical protein
MYVELNVSAPRTIDASVQSTDAESNAPDVLMISPICAAERTPMERGEVR